MPKQAKLNRIKSFKCYTISEAADIADVSTHTIRNWAKDGLRMLDASRPVLIRGDNLRDYIKGQRRKRRVSVQADEFYCMRCKGARKAAAQMADCTITSNRVKLTALCETCGTVVSKPIAHGQIDRFAQTLDLTIKRQATTL